MTTHSSLKIVRLGVFVIYLVNRWLRN